MLQQLNYNQLMEVYDSAIRLKLDFDFLQMLEQEIYNRKNKNSEVDRVTKEAVSK